MGNIDLVLGGSRRFGLCAVGVGGLTKCHVPAVACLGFEKMLARRTIDALGFREAKK